MERKRMSQWDGEHMATCSCRLRRCDYDELREMCSDAGTTVHSVVRLLVGKFLLYQGYEPSTGLKRDVERDLERRAPYKDGRTR